MVFNTSKIFCEGCKIKVNVGGMFGRGCNCIEFADGFYCEKCSVEMVNQRRKTFETNKEVEEVKKDKPKKLKFKPKNHRPYGRDY